MKRFTPNRWLFAAFVGGMIYPPLVYYGLSSFSPGILVSLGLALIGLRLLGVRQNADAKIWQIAFLIAAFILSSMFFVNAKLAVKAYPVVISLSVASIFGASLLFPPTLIERIARLTEPDLPAEGVGYTRRLTFIWFVVLLSNAAVSMAVSIWGTIAQWTLWNGFLSYVLMGTLFIGEWLIRKRVRA